MQSFPISPWSALTFALAALSGMWLGACDPPAEGICPTFEAAGVGNFFHCSVPFTCTDDDCDADPLVSPFDELGCLRRRCTDDAGCGAGEACYIVSRCFEGQGFPSHIACQDQNGEQGVYCECQMTSDLSSSVGWCIPEVDYPADCSPVGE